MKSTILKAAIGFSSLVSAVCVGDVCAGAIVFDNFAPNGTYLQWGPIIGRDAQYEQQVAQRFLTNSGGRLSEFTLGITSYHSSQGPDELTLSLVHDVNGAPGDTPLWQQTYVGLVPRAWGNPVDLVPDDFGAVVKFPVSNGPVLQAGARYWLTSRAGPSSHRTHIWWVSQIISGEPRAEKFGDYGEMVDWFVRDLRFNNLTLRVETVPEPATLALAAMAMVTGCCVARQRRPTTHAGAAGAGRTA